jgi:hypothetical protein
MGTPRPFVNYFEKPPSGARDPAEAVGNAKDEMVGRNVGLERSAAVEVGVIAGEAELIVAEQRDMRADAIFDADQAFDR